MKTNAYFWKYRQYISMKKQFNNDFKTILFNIGEKISIKKITFYAYCLASENAENEWNCY